MEAEKQAQAVPEQKDHEQEGKDEQTSKSLKKLCEECKENVFKYKCPACSLRSCSLPCVRAHKLRTACSGVRSKTHFVPLSQFDDNLLLSDYNLLEDVKRTAESARRTRIKLLANPYFKLPYYLQGLRKAAASRQIKLLLLPRGMSRREKNQTRYDLRKKFISWTIEWRFHSTDIVLLDHGVHEDSNLYSAIRKHLKPGPWMHPLRQFCEEELHSLNFFICKYAKGPKSPFLKLDADAPLRQQLANVVILEYPVIYVSLPSYSHHFGVVKEVTSVAKRPETWNVSDNIPSPKGVSFREEEIEEGDDSSEPQVFDFMNQEKGVMNQEKASLVHKMPCNNVDKKSPDKLSSDPSSANVEEDGSSYLASKDTKLEDFGDFDFDFEQGLIDAYFDLMTELNPDDLLDFEGIFANEAEVEEKKDLSESRGVSLIDEELEEGEIAE